MQKKEWLNGIKQASENKELKPDEVANAIAQFKRSKLYVRYGQRLPKGTPRRLAMSPQPKDFIANNGIPKNRNSVLSKMI